jgi:hypothetical protein
MLILFFQEKMFRGFRNNILVIKKAKFSWPLL